MIKLCKPEPAPCDTCPPLCQRKENYPRVCCQSCGLLLFSSMSDIFVPLKSNGERAQCNSMLHDSGPTDSVQQYNARVHVCYHSPQPPGWQGLPKGAELSDSLGALRKLSAGQCQQPHHGLGGLCNICNTSQHPPCVRFLILTCSCTALCCKCRCRTIMHVWTVAPRREWSTEYALQDTQLGKCHSGHAEPSVCLESGGGTQLGSWKVVWLSCRCTSTWLQSHNPPDKRHRGGPFQHLNLAYSRKLSELQGTLALLATAHPFCVDFLQSL